MFDILIFVFIIKRYYCNTSYSQKFQKGAKFSQFFLPLSKFFTFLKDFRGLILKGKKPKKKF